MTLLMTHGRARWLVVAIAVLVLASCGESGTVLRSGDAHVLVGPDDGDNIAGVGVGGTVVMVGDCLGLDESVVIWPPGTTLVSDDPLTIKVPGLGSVAVGDSIEGGGLIYEKGRPSGLESPETCQGKTVMSFFPNE